MSKKTATGLIPVESIQGKILLIRGHKVMLDQDLAVLYDVRTGALNRAVKRNLARFPEDFMFQLNEDEGEILKCQFGISSWGGRRTMPYVFTEQGVAMLSSVLRSECAMMVNIQIMRAFTKLRELLANHDDLKEKVLAMESKYDQQFQVVFEAIKQLLDDKTKPATKIGFAHVKHDED